MALRYRFITVSPVPRAACVVSLCWMYMTRMNLKNKKEGPPHSSPCPQPPASVFHTIRDSLLNTQIFPWTAFHGSVVLGNNMQVPLPALVRRGLCLPLHLLLHPPSSLPPRHALAFTRSTSLPHEPSNRRFQLPRSLPHPSFPGQFPLVTSWRW